MTCKLIAFDLDGTFLNDKKEIPPENLEALYEAHCRGIHLVPATGRVYIGIPPQIRELPFIRYFILGNGAIVYDAGEKRTIHRAEIPLPLCLRVIDYMDQLPVIYDCYQHDQGWMSEEMLMRLDAFFEDKAMLQYVKSVRTSVKNLRETLVERGESVQKLQMHFKNMEERTKQLAILPKVFPELLTSTSVKNNIEINSAQAGKDKGLRVLCQYLNLPMEETAAFGDGSNDTEMLLAAGLGIAMANGEKAVIAAADRITADNNAAGFAYGVWKWILSAEKNERRNK